MQKESVTLFTQPGCSKCIVVKRALDTRKLKYEIKDISKDSHAYDYVTKKLGYSQLPVVETDSDVWSGVDLDKLNKIK